MMQFSKSGFWSLKLLTLMWSVILTNASSVGLGCSIESSIDYDLYVCVCVRARACVYVCVHVWVYMGGPLDKTRHCLLQCAPVLVDSSVYSLTKPW
jgi:putative AlgH/UPF0301 family transcriptional regulator